ncbi:MAG: NUDIX hydrolase [Anaerolineae bacterium]
MNPLRAIADFAPAGTESGVGLALQDNAGRYLFFLAGERHHCPPGELFYAGIGGHREAGESWPACARREAWEEIHAPIKIISAGATWHISPRGAARPVVVADRPRPLALYQMIHPPGTPNAGQPYRIVIYRAKLRGLPNHLPSDELAGVIALTAGQVVRGPERRSTLAQLLSEGAAIVAGGAGVPRQTRLYPIGTAMALARILRHPTSGGSE